MNIPPEVLGLTAGEVMVSPGQVQYDNPASVTHHSNKTWPCLQIPPPAIITRWVLHQSL